MADGHNGDCYLVRKTKTKSVDKGFEDFSSMSSDASIIYPGALLRADSRLVTGNPAPIQQLKRSPIRITISGAAMKDGTSRSIEVVPNGASDIQDALSQLENNFAEDVDFAGQLDARIEKIESEQDMKLKMNFSQNMWGKLNVDFEAAQNKKSQIVMVDISQLYYTISVGSDLVGDSLFAEDETLENVQRQITNESPAVVVDSVNYGRRICASIETDDTSFDLQAAITASGLGGKVETSVNGEMHDKLSKCRVKVWIYGGTSTDAGRFVTMSFDDLMTAASETTGFKKSGALPISYTTRHITDGTRAKIVYTGDVWNTTTTETRSATKLNFSVSGIDHNKLNSGTVKVYGKTITDINSLGRPVLSEEQLLDEISFNYNTKTSGYGRLNGDVQRDTVRFEFEYDGDDHSDLAEGGVIYLNQIEGYETADYLNLSVNMDSASKRRYAYASISENDTVTGSKTLYEAGSVGEATYIKDIKVIGAKDDSYAIKKCEELQSQGWEWIHYDLNKGCGGGTHFIYLCYKTTNDPSEAIRDIIIRDDKNRPDTASVNGMQYTLCDFDGDNAFNALKGDLNRGAHGADIMFYYTKNENGNGKAITSITIDNSSKNAVSGMNLNKGSGGKDIFLHITKGLN